METWVWIIWSRISQRVSREHIWSRLRSFRVSICKWVIWRRTISKSQKNRVLVNRPLTTHRQSILAKKVKISKVMGSQKLLRLLNHREKERSGWKALIELVEMAHTLEKGLKSHTLLSQNWTRSCLELKMSVQWKARLLGKRCWNRFPGLINQLLRALKRSQSIIRALIRVSQSAILWPQSCL